MCVDVSGLLARRMPLDLYRLRWRIELGFKRLKGLVGLQGPPGTDKASARTCVLSHLLMMLLLEPLAEAFSADREAYRRAPLAAAA